MTALEFDVRLVLLGANLIAAGYWIGFDWRIGCAIACYGLIGVAVRLYWPDLPKPNQQYGSGNDSQ